MQTNTLKTRGAKLRAYRSGTAAFGIAAAGLTILMAFAASGVGAQDSASVPANSSARPASAPMTNKAAHPPGATASRPAEKKPAKAGAQSGPASAPAK